MGSETSQYHEKKSNEKSIVVVSEIDLGYIK